MEIVRKYITLPDARLSYLESGSASSHATSYILLHGMIATAETFLPLIEALPPDAHVVAFDMPGSGASYADDQLDASLFFIAGLLQVALIKLDIDKPILIGHSHGGAVALAMAAMQPDEMRALVLLAPAHPFTHHAHALIGFYLTPIGRLAAHSLGYLPQPILLAGFRRMAGDAHWDSTDSMEPYRRNLRQRATVRYLLRVLETWKADFRSLKQKLLPALKTPTLLIWGDDDRAVPHFTATALQERLQHAKSVVYGGIGHRPAEEAPLRVAASIREWLREIS